MQTDLQSSFYSSTSSSGVLRRRGPEILLPRTIELFAEAPPVQFAGYFGGFEVIDKHTGRTKRRFPLYFANLIVNEGLNALGATQADSLFTYALAGTGNTVPNATNTTLAAEVHRSNSSGGFPVEEGYDSTTTPATPYWYYRKPFLFAVPPGGATIYAEVGLASTNSAASDTMWSRALIRDAIGNQTTIAVAADEQLKLYYELRVYPPQNDIVQTVSATIRGVATNIDLTWRPCNVTNSQVWGPGGVIRGAGHGNTIHDPISAVMSNTTLVARTALPNNTNYTNDITRSEVAGGAGNPWIEHLNEWSAAAANFNIGSFCGGRQSTLSAAGGTRDYMLWQVLFTPTINKTSADKLIFRQRYTYTATAIP